MVFAEYSWTPGELVQAEVRHPGSLKKQRLSQQLPYDGRLTILCPGYPAHVLQELQASQPEYAALWLPCRARGRMHQLASSAYAR